MAQSSERSQIGGADMELQEHDYDWARALTYGNHPEHVVFHHAAATSAPPQRVHQWHLDRDWVGVGYHIMVAKDGTKHRGRPDNARGAHVKGWNDRTIGVMFEGNFENEEMTDAQVMAAAEIAIHYGLPIRGHSDFAATSCPGSNFRWDDVRAEIERLEDGKKEKKPKKKRRVRFMPVQNRNWVPLIGDWDGDGKDEIGFYYREEGRVLLTTRNDSGGFEADIDYRFGPQGNRFIVCVGDWNGDGKDNIGLYDPDDGKWYLSHGHESGEADVVQRYGPKNVF